jgi:phage shock protein PspC (stress-responsive transcriptional regulator)
MKKTIKINLTGVVFDIDEDAYMKLKQYLDSIRQYFSDKEESKEIMNDIEARIAELFQEKQSDASSVITIEMVNDVITIMGNPEDYVAATDGTESGAGQQKTRSSGRTRRLYRDPESSVISGVCGGLGAYFNTDPILFRILFIIMLFFGGASVLVYAILWIVIPRAETAAQKLEMRGEPVNVSNIEKKVREEYESAKEKIKETAQSEPVQRTKKATGDFFSALGKIFLVILKVLLIIIGTSLVLGGIGIIIGLISGTFVGLSILPFGSYEFTISEVLSPFTDPVSVALLVISITLLFLIPVIAMVYGLIKLIFSIKGRNRGLAIGSTTLWFVSLLVVISIFAFESNNFSRGGNDITKSDLEIITDTLYVAVNTKMEEDAEAFEWFDFDLDDEWMFSKDMKTIYGKMSLDIERSADDAYYLEIEKRSKGRNWEAADENAARLNYNFSTTYTGLVLDPWFSLDRDEKWRFPRVDLTLYVPEGKHIVLQSNTREYLEDIYNVEGVSDWRMAGKTWVMTNEGLRLVK